MKWRWWGSSQCLDTMASADVGEGRSDGEHRPLGLVSPLVSHENDVHLLALGGGVPGGGKGSVLMKAFRLCTREITHSCTHKHPFTRRHSCWPSGWIYLRKTRKFVRTHMCEQMRSCGAPGDVYERQSLREISKCPCHYHLSRPLLTLTFHCRLRPPLITDPHPVVKSSRNLEGGIVCICFIEEV